VESSWETEVWEREARIEEDVKVKAGFAGHSLRDRQPLDADNEGLR
jgi:hypothetical protein